MLLRELAVALSLEVLGGSEEIEVSDITCRTDEVTEGCIFVCIKGEESDGHLFIDEAYGRGARVFIVSDEARINDKYSIIKSKNPRKTMAEISSELYSHPERQIKIIGITGTKGKTTTLEYLSASLAAAKLKVLTVGTLGIRYCGKVIKKINNTTPDSYVIYKALRRAVDEGVEYAIIEVSSQALSMYRVWGIPFELCIFTSFSYDHIGKGEHKNLAEYFAAKKSLFTDYGVGCAVINFGDYYSERATESVDRVIRVGCAPRADFTLENIFSSADGAAFTYDGVDFPLSVFGEYNARNAALALAAACIITNKRASFFKSAIRRVKISGRFEIYELHGRNIIIDFAHNAESVKSICSAVRKFSLGKIILVFGSVGGRCHTRREALAHAAEQFADYSIITADNPCEESVERICNDIYSHFSDKSRATVITDREKAIKRAVEISSPADSVLLIGKGHEDYQQIGKRKIPFSEREIIRSLGAR